ncbi:hypothetical protein SAMN05421692_4207 [Chryseobacterium indologenes]|nr:hypothetical protein SAMN05421692_4207 [Chryseobacterium indologenes]SUX52709.1 Uncharacterised protein [Chryseobacterium indologenes]VFA43537.1 Uncharacterised protein [Chryseobacterium indologenes]
MYEKYYISTERLCKYSKLTNSLACIHLKNIFLFLYLNSIYKISPIQ